MTHSSVRTDKRGYDVTSFPFSCPGVLDLNILQFAKTTPLNSLTEPNYDNVGSYKNIG